MKRVSLFVVLSVLAFTSLPYSQVSKTGTTVAGFLSIDVGARAVGMGGAYTSVTEDVTAMYWNPSGIARIPHKSVVFCHNNWIADISFNFAGVAIPLGNAGVIGLNATFLSMDDMQITTVDEPEGIQNGYFSAGSYALGLTYGRTLTDKFSIGFSAKILNEHIYNSNATGVAVDLGTLYDTQFNGLKIGMSISNFGTKMRMEGKDMLVQHDIDEALHGNNPYINANLETDKFDLPLMFRVGISMDVLKGRGNSNLVLAVDALHPNNNHESLDIGAEYLFNQMFALRGGYNTLFLEDDETGLSLGAGLKYGLGSTSFGIDYAYRDFGVLKDVQMFSVYLNF